MKTEIANLRRLDILGNGDCSSAQEMLTAVLKQCRQKLAYCSMLAAFPALMVSLGSEARVEEAEKQETIFAGQSTRLSETLNMSCGNPTLLKRQSEYLLPHQNDSFNLLAPLAGNDDCPGFTIPGGSYTAAAPYIDSGDTTGANNTVTRARYYYYCYYYENVPGSDQVYSFTLTGVGANPEIHISRTSGTYEPKAYILDSRLAGGCPASTGSEPCGLIAWSFSPAGATATIESQQMKSLPLNVPLHLFVDSARVDASGSGPYTIRIQDVTIAGPVCTSPNSIDCTDFFVRQHYLDFLGREPDPPGFSGWQNIVNNCGTTVQQPCDRIEVSSAFFRSTEFQGRGYFIYRFYSLVGRIPIYEEFTSDFGKVSGFLTDQQLEANKAAFVDEFIARAEFQNRYGTTFNSPTAYVDALLQTIGLPNHPLRQSWINTLNSNNNTQTRAQVLRALVESEEVYQKYYNEAFVIMQYFGFLRRTADASYLSWIQTMNDAKGDYRVMINGFLNSSEYRKRFGP